MAHDVVDLDVPVLRLEAPKWLLAGVLVLIGVVAFILALVTDTDRAWHAYLYNWMFFACIASGAVMLSAVVTIARGLWSQPIRRIAMGFVAYLPISFLLYIPLMFVGRHIFPWVHGGLPPGKTAWLNLPFVAVRNVLAQLAFVSVAVAFAYWSLRPDAGLARDGAPTHLDGVYARLTRRWRGQEQEEIRASHNTAVLAPVMVLLYALSFSLIAFDYVMSLDPEWKSTLLGGYFFMSAFLGGIAATSVAVFFYGRSLDLSNEIRPTNVHDLGKLHFAFNIFWAYLFWAQFIVIWYGLLPNEQNWVSYRFGHPYFVIAVLVLLCLFVIPFFTLLGVKPKRTPWILATVSTIVLLGLWFERNLLVYPSWYHETGRIIFGWQEIGITLGFAGLLLGAVTWFGSRFPVLQLWRPLAELELLGHLKQDPMEQVTES